MRIRINPVSGSEAYAKVQPDFIYNRMDLFCLEGQFQAVTISAKNRETVVQYRILGDTCEIGLWLVDITMEELEALLLYIRSAHPGVRFASYTNGVLPCGNARQHNHFRIVFPETVEEMQRSISSKSRAKMQKKVRRCEEAYGPLQLFEYDRDTLPAEVVDAFFRFKAIIRKREYDLTPEEYLNRYHVSHCYVAKFGDTIGAIRFSCEQCPVVYGENFTYNPDLSDYSLGRFIFMHHLIRMVEKKHTQLFFAGGDYDYKKHYGSIEEPLYDCKVDLNKLAADVKNRKSISRRAQRFLKKHLPSGGANFLRRVKRGIKRRLKK